MTTQPEALRLANLLEQIDGQHWQVQDSAAAELRRLYAELERCKQVCAATAEGWRTDAALAEPVQDSCDHCNHPMYCAIKCKVCGRTT